MEPRIPAGPTGTESLTPLREAVEKTALNGTGWWTRQWKAGGQPLRTLKGAWEGIVLLYSGAGDLRRHFDRVQRRRQARICPPPPI